MVDKLKSQRRLLHGTGAFWQSSKKIDFSRLFLRLQFLKVGPDEPLPGFSCKMAIWENGIQVNKIRDFDIRGNEIRDFDIRENEFEIWDCNRSA